MATGPFNKSKLNSLYSSCDFPVHRRELIAMASEEQMPAPFMKAMQQIPKKMYQGVDDIYEQLNSNGRSRPRA